MIIVALKLDHTAAVVDPSPIAQGTDSENIVLLSPFPVRCPVMMGWVMPDGSPVEIPLDDTEHSPKTRYWNMTNIVLPEGFSGNVQSVWAFKPTANLTAQYGKALACFYVQQPVQSEDPLTHETIQGYKSLTYNPVEINIAETLNPIPDGELEPASSLLEQVLAAITYYNTYLTDIEENGVSTVYDTEGEPQREVHTDAEATEDSNNLITSDAVYKAVQGAKDYADTVSGEAEERAKSAAQGYADTAESTAKAYTDEVVQNLPVSGAQQQAIDEAEQRAKAAAQGYANTAEENAKAYADSVAESEAADALNEAKAYTNEKIGERVGATVRVNTAGADETHAVSDITLKQGDGFAPEENPVIEIPLQYNRLNDIDNSLTSNSTFSDVVQKMYKNSVLRVSTIRSLEKPDGGQSDYFLRNLIPQEAEGVDGLLKIRKHNTHLRDNAGQYYYTDVLNVEARYKEKKHLFGFERLKSSLASIGFNGQLVVNDKAYEGYGNQGVKIRDLTDLNSAEYTIAVPPVDPGRTVFVSGGSFHKFVSYNNLAYFIGFWQAVGSKVGLFTIDADDNISFVLDISQYVNVEANVHPMAIVDDTLYVGSYGEKVAVVDLLNNTVTGITKPTNEPTYAISARGNTVAIVSNASSILTLYDISEQQFSEVTMPVQMTTMYSIAVYQSDDAIFVCNRDIYCYKNNEFTLIASDFALYCGMMLGNTLFLCSASYRYTQMAKLYLTNDEFSYIIFPATTSSDPRCIKGILAYDGKVYMTDYESYYLVDPPVDVYEGIYDEDGIKWQKQASDNDVNAVEEKLNTDVNAVDEKLDTAVEQFQDAIEGLSGDITAVQGDVDNVEDAFSSFVKANNEEETAGLTYTYDDTTGTAVCTGGTVSGGVHIPCYTEHDGKWYKVIDIAQNAFKDNTGIQAVYFPQTIEHIGISAFENCTGLTLIRFKPSVGYGKAQIGTIENSAFKGCSSLATIDGVDGNSIIVSGQLNIGVSAFQGCALTSLTISAPQVVLGASAFMNCTALTDISIDYFVSAGTNVFSGCTSLTTVDITNDKTAKVTVPSGATVNYYRRWKNPVNPVRKYLHSFKVHSSTVPTSLDPYKMEGEIVIASERNTAYTTVAQILADTTKMYISANGYGLVYSSTGTNVCPLSKVDDNSTAIGIAVFKDNPQQSLLNIFLNDNSTGYTFTDTVMSLE